jgi:hypothetical protein
MIKNIDYLTTINEEDTIMTILEIFNDTFEYDELIFCEETNNNNGIFYFPKQKFIESSRNIRTMYHSFVKNKLSNIDYDSIISIKKKILLSDLNKYFEEIEYNQM